MRSGKVTKKVSFVVSHLVPAYGMEKVIMDVAEILSEKIEVEVVLVSGSEIPHDRLANVAVSSQGKDLRGIRRLATIARMWKGRDNTSETTFVLVGAWTAIPWLLVATAEQRAKALVWEHSLVEERIRHSWSMRILGFAAERLYHRAAGFVGVSKPVTDDFRNLRYSRRPRRIWTVHNPVDTPASLTKVIQDRAARWNPDSPRTLLCVGSLTKIKRQDIALEALAHLDGNFRLVLVGDGPERERLARLAEKLNVTDRVDFRGHLTPALTTKAMIDADALVHCSASETFGLVFAEAANVGLPVIATRIRATEVFIPNIVPGIVVPPNPLALRDAIIEVTGTKIDPTIIQRSRDSREIALSPESILDEWLALLDDINKQGTGSVGVA